MLTGFLCEVHAQSAVSQLRKYCAVSKTAEYILENAGTEKSTSVKISELTTKKLKKQIIIDYTYRRDIPLNTVANDIWSLISKQLNGELGRLTTTGMPNYILTSNVDGEWKIVFVMWNNDWHKWALWSCDIDSINGVREGCRSIEFVE